MEKITIDKKGKNYFLALQKKYEAQKQEALSNLETYFNNPVGIGEHSDLLTEFDKWIEVLANASDKLETLNNNFELPTSRV
jgi:fructose-1,6-bisphosphatase